MTQNLPDFLQGEFPLREFVTKKLIGIQSSSTVQEAAQKMTDFNISSLVALKNDEVVGFMTESDLKKKVVALGKSSDTPVSEIMNDKLIKININLTIKEAMQEMVDNDIKHLLVEENDEIIGILTFTDFLTIEQQKLETFIARE